ncbi:septum formation family protein [Arthrobacter woluwensis]|uniref:septum formation family protein n=1 Tax=Arthrobacter woluwensis TaxID=156980 RepID=UPI003803D819
MSEPTQGHDDGAGQPGAAPGPGQPSQAPGHPGQQPPLPPTAQPQSQPAQGFPQQPQPTQGYPQQPQQPGYGAPGSPGNPAENPAPGQPSYDPRTNTYGGQQNGPQIAGPQNGPVYGAPTGYPGGYPAQQPPAKKSNKGLVIGGAVVGGIVVILLVVWLVNLVVGGMTPKADPTAPPATSNGRTTPAPGQSGSAAPSDAETISALDAKKGQCFWGYPDNSNSRLVVVDCGENHSAQLVNVYYYQQDEAFPGVDTFKTKGRELCRTASLSSDVDSLNLRQRFAYPSQKSWDAGDRRVDCIVFSDDGNTLTKSLTK